MKIFCITFILIFLTFFGGSRLFAQRNDKLIAPEFDINLPVGALSTGSSVGLGFMAQAQFPVQKSGFSVLARTGLDVFFARNYSYYDGFQYVSTSGTTGFAVPLLIGGRYYVIDKLHTDLELGVEIGLNSGSTTNFDFAPSVGYSFAAGKGNIDPFIRLSTSFGNGSFFTFGARYQFELGK